ncbi:MAG: DUF3047 domain-containing protein [Proteobacteria bacterium]|nr:DUF3047 domain-containing protein [Pseudomonadota bacterium]
MRPTRLVPLLAASMALGAVAQTPPAQPPAALAAVTAAALPPFSAGAPGRALPPGWVTVPINERKTPTRYDVVLDAGTPVLHAVADSSASLVGHELAMDIAATPVAHWRWKVAGVVPGGDNTTRDHEDAAARVIFEFDGDRSRLPIGDQAAFRLSKIVSGRVLAYATLMYVWSSNAPVDTMIVDPFTDRIMIVVATTGNADAGHWVAVTRNLATDFRRAFGEAPGKLVSVSVMTDTDNTGTHAEAWYGDITLGPAQR